MDEFSLDDLLAGLEVAQRKKSTVRLSERNVVELVIKLKELGFLGDELLHTSNGREYITRDKLREEVAEAVDQAGGRMSLVDLPSALCVDFAHCERAAQEMVLMSHGDIVQTQGELFASRYFDNLAVDVDQSLHERGVEVVGDLARKFGIGVDMLQGALQSRMGRSVHGRLEGGVIYTDAYLSRVKAQLRGALRGALSPVSLNSLRRDLGLEKFGALSALVPSLVDELQRTEAIAGKCSAGNWIPATYSAAQQDSIRTFFQQNGYVEYDTATKHGISNPLQYLKSAFPDGLPLVSAYVAPVIIHQLEAALEDVMLSGSWCDARDHIPTALEADDAALMLDKCKNCNAKGLSGIHVIAETCAVSDVFLDGIRKTLKEEAVHAASEAHKRKKEADAANTAAAVAALGGGGGKKEGRQPQLVAGRGGSGSGSDDDWDVGKSKGGKKGKGGKNKGKSGGGGKPTAAAGKQQSGGGGGGGGGNKARGGNASCIAACLSPEALLGRVLALHEDLEDAGISGELASGIVVLVRPAVVAEYERVLTDIFTAGADRRRRLREAAITRLTTSFETFQVQAQGIELFLGDDNTVNILRRHLMRVAAPPCLDSLLHFLEADAAADDSETIDGQGTAAPLEPEKVVEASFSASARASFVREAPGEAKAELAAVVDSMTTPTTTPAEFISALEGAAGALGLRLKHVDKKREAALVDAAAETLRRQAAEASDAASLLAIAVPLLLAKYCKKSVSLPGKALSVAVEVLMEYLDEEEHALLGEFHEAVVERLKTGGSSDGDDNSKIDAMACRVRTLID